MAKALQLGRYHLLDRIAFGGMAEIYRAKTFDEEGRVHMVAIKRILSHLARDEEFIKMLVDEAKIASLMEHESIARVYEFCYAHGEYFIAMEYVDGKDGRTILDRCRAQRRWVPPELCAFIMMHIMRGLHQAHNQTDREGRALHLIHRDVSPSNVICSYAGEVKLCDFGIAKATLSTVQTRSGVIKGKVKYMSPEQAMGRKLDPRTDIFSGGSVLYELLTRVPPFLAPNEMELLVLVRETRYTSVRTRNPMVPPALEAIVDTAMSRKPQDRYQTADEFADALEEYLAIHAPKLTRSHLGRFARQLFADDIEKELRALEEYLVEGADNEEVGVNLIADVLGPGADYSKFSPSSPSTVEDEVEQSPRDGEIDVDQGDDSRVLDPALSDSPTVILEGAATVEVWPLAVGSAIQEAEVLWQKSGAFDPCPPLAEGTATESDLAPIHDAHTVILDLEEGEDTSPGVEPDPGTPEPRPARDTTEVPTVVPRKGPLAAGAEPGGSPCSSGASIHEMDTGQIENHLPTETPLSQAQTEQLEVSDLISIEGAQGAAGTDEQEVGPEEIFGGDGAAPSADEMAVSELPEDGIDHSVGSVTLPGLGLPPVTESTIHTETTQLLEVDGLDLEPEADRPDPDREHE